MWRVGAKSRETNTGMRVVPKRVVFVRWLIHCVDVDATCDMSCVCTGCTARDSVHAVLDCDVIWMKQATVIDQTLESARV